MQGSIISCRQISREFDGFKAVDGFDLEIKTGEIHALIGPNGAGKTTVFNLLTGFLSLSGGEIWSSGINISRYSPERRVDIGIVRSFQISAVFADMSVLDNLRVALLTKHGKVWQNWGGDRALAAFDQEARELLQRFELLDAIDVPAKNLPYGKKRALELATTLARDPKVMLLDEPTQGMGVEDVSRMTTLIQEAARGRTVVMVEHNLKVVATLANTITVLARGRKIAEGDYTEVSSHPAVKEAYLGHRPVGEAA